MLVEVARARKRSPLGKIPVGFYLDKSVQIKDKAGKPVRGLFTSKFIRGGRLIGEYRGLKVDEKRTQTKRRFTQYFFAVYEQDGKRIQFVIDGGNSKKSSFLRYVNAPNQPREGNAKFVQDGDAILLYAKKNIQPKTEVLAWYGKHTAEILKQH